MIYYFYLNKNFRVIVSYHLLPDHTYICSMVQNDWTAEDITDTLDTLQLAVYATLELRMVNNKGNKDVN